MIRALEDDEDAFFTAAERVRGFDAESFESFVRDHKLLPWLARVESDPRAEGLLSDTLLRALRETRAAQPERAARLLRETADLCDALRDCGAEPLLLRGQYLAERFYGDLNLRHQWDVDVLVRPVHFDTAIDALATIGYGGFDPERRRAMSMRAPDAWHAISLQRDDFEIDLHWTLRNRVLERLDEDHLWTTRQVFRLDGVDLETLSIEDTLVHMLLSIAVDLRRGALRAKLWLDLGLALGALAPGIDWETFLQRRDREGILGLSVNVLAVFCRLWSRPGELDGLGRALARHAAITVVGDEEGVLTLVTRPRHAPENRKWFERIVGSRPRGRRWWPGRAARVEGPMLPPALDRLLEENGLEVSQAKQVSSLPGAHSPRRSFWIALTDGRELKGRRVRDASAGARMERGLSLLPREGFPALLARSDEATLETWCAGRPCVSGDAGLLGTAGEMLGTVHTCLPRENVPARDSRFLERLRVLDEFVDLLHQAGRLDLPAAERILAIVHEGSPPEAIWGLRHGDFCLGNLVAADGGVSCVDNEAIGEGFLASDLAHTFYRWPMEPADRTLFLAGYRKHAEPADFLGHERFWAIGACLESAVLRQRIGAGSVDVPLRVLARHVA